MAEKWFGDLVDLGEAERFRTDEAGMGDEVMALFRSEVLDALEGLDTAVRGRDWMQVREHAHSLQGMGGAVGAPEISLVGLALSDGAKGEQAKRVEALVEALRGWAGEWRGPAEGGAGARRHKLELEGNLLVVDDERANREFLRELLEDCGARVMTAAGGEEALALVRRQLPDVALVDVNMPGMDGYGVCRRFKELPGLRRTAIIMVTARTRVEDIETGFELGAFDYIRKPYHSRELLARVQNALHLKRRTDELTSWKERLSRELRMAGALQSSLFNPVPIMQGHCDVHTAYSPSRQIGGDCFDVGRGAEGRLQGYVADVAGHGVASALVSTLIKGLFTEAFSLPGPPPLYEVANRVHARFREMISDPELYATGFLFRLDPKTRAFQGLNMGHPSPLVFTEGGRRWEGDWPDVGGMPLGMWPVEEVPPYKADDEIGVVLPDGARVFLYSDGLIEARNAAGEEVGEEGLAAACARVSGALGGQGDPAAVLATLRARGVEVAEDDCTLMAIYCLRKESIRVEETFTAEVEEVARVAEAVGEALRAEGWSADSAAMAKLVAMEHGMNIVDHAGVPGGESCECRMVLEQEGGVCRLLFRDPGRKWIPRPVRTFKPPPTPAEASERGRGWQLIQSLCARTFYFRREHWNHHAFDLVRGAGTDRSGFSESPSAESWHA